MVQIFELWRIQFNSGRNIYQLMLLHVCTFPKYRWPHMLLKCNVLDLIHACTCHTKDQRQKKEIQAEKKKSKLALLDTDRRKTLHIVGQSKPSMLFEPPMAPKRAPLEMFQGRTRLQNRTSAKKCRKNKTTKRYIISKERNVNRNLDHCAAAKTDLWKYSWNLGAHALFCLSRGVHNTMVGGSGQYFINIFETVAIKKLSMIKRSWSFQSCSLQASKLSLITCGALKNIWRRCSRPSRLEHNSDKLSRIIMKWQSMPFSKQVKTIPTSLKINEFSILLASFVYFGRIFFQILWS